MNFLILFVKNAGISLKSTLNLINCTNNVKIYLRSVVINQWKEGMTLYEKKRNNKNHWNILFPCNSCRIKLSYNRLYRSCMILIR